MSRPVEPTPPSPPKHEGDVDVPALANAIRTHTLSLIDQIHNVLENPGDADSPNDMDEMAQTIVALAQHAQTAATILGSESILRENLKDAGDIITHIFTQSLSVPGAKRDVSMLEAAKSFRTDNALTSDLRNILLSLLQFPEPTETMLRELEILCTDLKTQ